VDNNGNETPNKDFIPPSVVLMNADMKFNPGSKMASLKAVDDTTDFEYRLVDGDTDMPAFYVGEWSHPKTDRCVLSDETLNAL